MPFRPADLPMSQVSPSNPALHRQENLFKWSEQVAPFMHGWLAHSSISVRQQDNAFM